MIKLVRTDSSNQYFEILVSQLDKDLHNRNGEMQDKYTKYNVIEACNTVVIVLDENIPVGCGCFKKIDKDTAEIKRMFVHSQYRGQGISKKILGELENWAKEKGYTTTILETGINQTEAIGLYKNTGYIVTENYGPYIDMDTSICMKKQISN